MRTEEFAVYILASHSRRLYVGMTGDLFSRMWRRRNGTTPSFARRDRINRLVWYEQTPNAHAAIAREKEIKGWDRAKRVQLIESQNPGWLHLSADWFR